MNPAANSGASPDERTSASARERMILELTDRVAAGGDVIGHLEDGRVVFVEGALPSEQVEVEVRQLKKDFARASTLRVLRASPDRISPYCPHRLNGCGGCGWQEISRPAQARYKREILIDSLRRLGRLEDPPVEEMLVVDDPGRTTLRVEVEADGAPAFHRRGSSSTVPVDSCPVSSEHLSSLLGQIRLQGVSAATLRISEDSGERLIALDRFPKGELDMPEDVVVALEDGKLLRVEHSGRRRKASITEVIGGTSFRISAGSFSQSSPAVAMAIVETVDRLLGDRPDRADRLLDAYSGVGVIGLLLAQRRDLEVAMVESHPPAAADARYNASKLKSQGVMAEVAEFEFGDFRGGGFPVVVADPARPGLGRPGVESIVAAGAHTVVLVSCDPASLARDSRLLGERGYRLETVVPVGAFVDTAHVEAVSLFTRRV